MRKEIRFRIAHYAGTLITYKFTSSIRGAWWAATDMTARTATASTVLKEYRLPDSAINSALIATAEPRINQPVWDLPVGLLAS